MTNFTQVLRVALLCLASGVSSAAAQPEAVDLELVLAVDASSSIDIGEYALQLRGIANAFRDPDIQGAITAGRHKRIAVNVVIWSDADVAKQTTGWFVLSTPTEANRFSALLEAIPRRQYGSTAIGEGITFALNQIAGNNIEGERRTIDVSGDGREYVDPRSSIVLLPEARRRAAAARVTINGLAVVNDVKQLFEYYDEKVRQGPDSFVLSAQDYVDFDHAVRIKLFREIVGAQEVQLQPSLPHAVQGAVLARRQPLNNQRRMTAAR